MSSRKTKRKNAIQLIALVAAVAVVVIASILFQNWWNNRPAPEPRDVSVEASAGETTIKVAPYRICGWDSECTEEELPTIAVAPDQSLRVTLPKAIANHEWKLLTIYDDPAANDEFFYKANEKKEIEIPGSVDPVSKENNAPRPRLLVVEINAVMIGHDEKGEETPYAVTWSVGTEYSTSDEAKKKQEALIPTEETTATPAPQK